MESKSEKSDARRLSARLREAASSFTMPASYVDAIEDAARLAELVEAWKEARRAMGQHNMAPQRERVREAESALLRFDLIGRGGVDG